MVYHIKEHPDTGSKAIGGVIPALKGFSKGRVYSRTKLKGNSE